MAAVPRFSEVFGCSVTSSVPNRAVGCLSKFSSSEIFNQLRSITCRVTSSAGYSTGFFVTNNGCLIASFHALKKDDWIHTKEIRVEFNGKEYPVEIYLLPRTEGEEVKDNIEGCTQVWIEKANRLDLALLKISETTNWLPIIPETFLINGGEKIYFGGYPLGQRNFTFHKGMISSIEMQNGLSRLTLDGTVVPGHSGSPVVVQQEGKLYVAGVLSAQAHDLSKEFLLFEEILGSLRQKKVLPEEAPYMTLSLPREWRHSIDSEKFVSTSDFLDRSQWETQSFSLTDLIAICLTGIKRSLSTGIGKAIDARHIKLLEAGRTLPIAEPMSCIVNELPVMRGEHLPGHLGTDEVYRGWYHRTVKGSSLCGTLFGRLIQGGEDAITKEEELILWRYWCQGQGSGTPRTTKEIPSIEQRIEKLETKVYQATPKSLKHSSGIFLEEITAIRQSIGEDPNLALWEKKLLSLEQEIKSKKS